jgi:predicted nucleic-acid-binding Zn-ribbon protein
VSSWKRNCNHTFNFVENLIDGVYYFKIVCSKCGYTNIYSIKQEDYLKWKENNS